MPSTEILMRPVYCPICQREITERPSDNLVEITCPNPDCGERFWLTFEGVEMILADLIRWIPDSDSPYQAHPVGKDYARAISEGAFKSCYAAEEAMRFPWSWVKLSQVGDRHFFRRGPVVL
jgi:hypothetical protein